MGKPTPKWLQERIEERAEASRRAAKPEQCRKCGADVLQGPSDDHMYWIATVDPEPVDAFTEALGVVAGRMSYDLLPRRGETHLSVRFPWHMKIQPPRYPIVLDHRCEGK